LPVLTQKERMNVSLKKETLEINLADLEKITKSAKTIKKSIFTYYLLHPENGFDCLQEFEDVIKIDNKEYNRICNGGVVKTSEEPLADFLLKKGYLLMEKLEEV